ncbi:MAG TPA: GEVED domain-containing protein, partial [Lacibacter sp.]|nr:GEVED domain-containing protein [Lacibacter sp.]
SFNVSVLNNTGANATLIGWIDLNNDGVFQASEGRSFTVASNASQQTVSIGWSSVNVSAAIGTRIFLRIRLTSSANGMTTSNTTGYFNDGEVEDYPVTVSAVLPELPELQAYKNSNKSAVLVWKAPSELLVAVTEVQKSADGITWKTIASYDKQTGFVQQTDNDVYVPQTFYRLKFTGINQVIQYSAVRILKYNQLENLSIFPNPASTQATASIFVTMKGVATVQLLNIQGITVWQQNVYFQAGSNQLQLTQLNRFPPGIYRLRITTAADTQTIPFMIQ